MSLCDDYADWADLDLDFPDDFDIEKAEDEERTRRTELLSRAINDYLTENGYDPVDVSYGTMANARDAAETDTQTGSITFDNDYILRAGRDDAYDTAYHETWHAMEAQDHSNDLLSEDERAIYNDLTSDEPYSDEDSPFHHVLPEHEYADIFAQFMLDQLADECEGAPKYPPAGAESASEETDEQLDWEDDEEDDEPGSGSDSSTGESGETVGDEYETIYGDPIIIDLGR